jgi:hypothetical protein
MLKPAMTVIRLVGSGELSRLKFGVDGGGDRITSAPRSKEVDVEVLEYGSVAGL